MPNWQAISAALIEHGIEIATQSDGTAGSPRPVSGGDINAAWRLNATDVSLFIKTGPLSAVDMFAAEADGLREIAQAACVRVPRVHACGPAGPDAFIALEWVNFEPVSTRTERKLGSALAAMHRHTADRFGWYRDNTIGRTPQHNPWTDSWVEFFREHRLLFQLELAKASGYTGEIQDLGRKLTNGLQNLFADYDPVPSLLHGDLWGGNWASADGGPIIFDPAVYYGDRESDLAMTRLFGGFGAAFYESYEEAWPAAAGAEERCELYQLYHLLNHVNLFGGGYAGSAIKSLRKLCRHL
ncbi:MAG: fructosamine kinase family protein [Gammaproteobacteria bacterium]|nr:fructosamine kinase family protein [Gammaproteobacteria bacterium]